MKKPKQAEQAEEKVVVNVTTTADAADNTPGEGVQEGGGLPPVAATTPEAGATEDSPHVADEIHEIEIIAKIRAGLTREQAIEVINNQRSHDKALAEG